MDLFSMTASKNGKKSNNEPQIMLIKDDKVQYVKSLKQALAEHL